MKYPQFLSIQIRFQNPNFMKLKPKVIRVNADLSIKSITWCWPWIYMIIINDTPQASKTNIVTIMMQ